MASDPPRNFETAELELSRFLASQAYPSSVVWTLMKDVIVDESGHYFIRQRDSRPALAKRYAVGVGRGMGVELRAICASQTRTFACIHIPEDAVDAEYRMIGVGLKLSCPDRLMPGTLVSNAFRWWLLTLVHRKRSAMLQEL